MSPEILTIIGMTTTILIATWTMNRGLRLELREEIREIRGEVREVRVDIQDLRIELKDEIHGLPEHLMIAKPNQTATNKVVALGFGL